MLLCAKQYPELLRKFGQLVGNFPSWLAIPMNCQSSEMWFGVFICLIADILSGSAMMPCSLMMCPRNFTLFCRKEHFALFRVTPAASIRSSTAASLVSCSTLVFPWIRHHQLDTRLHPALPGVRSSVFESTLEHLQCQRAA